MKKRFSFLYAFSAFLSFSASAAEVIDRPDYTMYIAGTLDQWSGNQKDLTESSRDHTKKLVTYSIGLREKFFIIGNPSIFTGPSDHPIINRANSSLAAAGFSTPNQSLNYFRINPPVVIPAEMLPKIAAAQSELRKRSTLAQGDPSTLQERVATKKLVGNLAAIGLTVFAGANAGAAGASAVLGSGAASDLATTVGRFGSAISPVSLALDPVEPDQLVEFRKVITRNQDRAGQVVIVYKREKTPQIEEDALVEAVLALSGAKQTPEAISSARQQDFQERSSMWRACVNAGECGK